MRVCLLIVTFLFQMITASAQEQERKLIDRLLKPDAKLQYPQQTKSFSQQRTTPTHSSATRSFYIAEKNLSKTFVADRHFFCRRRLGRQPQCFAHKCLIIPEQ